MLFQGQRILVTGGTGFIGSHLVEKLLLEGAEVTVLTRQDKKSNRVTFLKGDINDADIVDKAAKNKNIIYHLAGYADVAGATRNPEVAFQTDVLGTFNLLNSARINGVSRIIYVSTARVYGDPQYEPQDEDHPLTPKEFYGANKLIGETYCKVFGSTYGIQTVIIRPFSVYGEGQVPKKGSLSGVVSIFARNAMEGRDLQITGDGEQAKDFIHVDDTVSALILAGVNQDCVGTTTNIGSGKKVSINQLAELIIQKTGYTSNIVHTPQVGENVNNLADISKARKILGFTPTINLEEGVIRYIRWLKKLSRETART